MLALSGQTHLKSSVLSSVKKVKYSISYAAEMWRYILFQASGLAEWKSHLPSFILVQGLTEAAVLFERKQIQTLTYTKYSQLFHSTQSNKSHE